MILQKLFYLCYYQGSAIICNTGILNAGESLEFLAFMAVFRHKFRPTKEEVMANHLVISPVPRRGFNSFLHGLVKFQLGAAVFNGVDKPIERFDTGGRVGRAPKCELNHFNFTDLSS